ncbi:MAG: hypothetical protein ACOYBT_09845 [Polynucleobacter sp.]
MSVYMLPERFVLTIEGKLYTALVRSNVVPRQLPDMLAALLTGRAIDLSAFAAFGLRVSVEEDTDQANDEPDVLAVPTWPAGLKAL